MNRPRAFTALILSFFILLGLAESLHATETLPSVRIGVPAKRGMDHCRAKWQPTADYLSSKVAGNRFEIVPPGFRPMAKLSHTSDKLAEKAGQALFQRGDRSDAAVAAQCAGWTYPLSYSPVRDGLKELQLGPYDSNAKQTLEAFYRRYKVWFFSGGLAFLLLLITAVSVGKLITRLTAVNADLLREIKRRKEGEARLFESETRLKTILDKSIAGVFIIDPVDHTILDANQSALNMVGAEKDAVVGRKCHGFICPEKKGQCPVIDHGITLNRSERMLLRADGSRCPILKTVTRFSLHGRELLLDSFIDISELKESLLNLESALSVANEANKAKDQFLANVSHELRTPMNGIIGMTNILQNTDLSVEQAEYAQIIMKSSEGLLRIINDTLDFAHIASTRPKLESIDFDLHVLVDDVMSSISAIADEKKLTCTHLVDASVPGFLRGDRRRIKRILQILMNNAVKFTSVGSVSLHISRGRAEGKKCTLYFKVQDTGIGIGADRIENIFTPFTQVDYSSTRKCGGVGLGLALAKHFTEMMGGEIFVKSAPEMGSTFQVRLTLAIQDTIPVKKPPRIEQLIHHRILVVEDNVVNQKVMLNILNKNGFRTDVVNNGRQAVEALCRKAYDLVLMDIQMPEMNGFEATSAIRNPSNKCKNPCVPIIAVTANAMKYAKTECLDAGMDDYLPKPVVPEILTKKVQQWCDKSRMVQPPGTGYCN